MAEAVVDSYEKRWGDAHDRGGGGLGDFSDPFSHTPKYWERRSHSLKEVGERRPPAFREESTPDKTNASVKLSAL